MPQLDRLGLRENPFNKNTEQRYFYADQNRAQTLESTEHLIDYSSNFQVIIGESGVGKSHLLETIANRVDNNWRIAKINNVEQYDTLSLIQAILDAFGTIDSGHSELLEVLETQLAEINQLGFKPVLLVDRAQTLSTDSLRFLIQLSQQKQKEEPYISIVLFATDEITELLQSAELKHFREVIHIATLNRFDKEGVSGFLRHKMAAAGYDRESPFTPRIIDSIFSDSQGLPEKINFFANKFLVSSGKAENYIAFNSESDLKTSSEPDPMAAYNLNLDDPSDEYESTLEHNENLVGSIKEDELEGHRSDRAAEQLSRLAEKFEEIEQLGEQSSDTFFADKRGGDDQEQYNQESPDVDQSEKVFFDEHSMNDAAEDGASSSALPKFIIPIAIIGILLVAIFVSNSVFEQSEQTDQQQAAKEKIELLPLELPPQGSYLQHDTVQESAPTATVNAQAEEMLSESINTQTQTLEIETPQEAENQLDVVETITPQSENTLLTAKEKPVTPAAEKIDESTSVSVAIPKLLRVEPEPIIGANSRQYIMIIGRQLAKDDSLLVTWSGNKKEFSAKKTPEQWQYINDNKIKLHLSTGIKTQQWQVLAKNAQGAESQTINFDVVRPFIAKMEIKQILPTPFIGSDKRQAVIIMGQGFSKQTSIELKWDKNKKHFSSRLTPSQFEFVNANQIKLFIATGKKERKWRVLATNPTGSISTASFAVTKNTPKVISDKTANHYKGLNWLKQQVDTNYTIQLFGSYNKKAIDDLVTKHSLKGEILRFETQKEGKPWFTMTYGNFSTKQEANAAVVTLDPALTNPMPWIRSLGGIKEKLGLGIKPVTKTEASQKTLLTRTTTLATDGLSINDPSKTTKSTSSVTQVSSPATVAPPKVKDEAWIWTQNPASYTLQLIALSSKAGVDDYIKKFNLQSESVYFKTIRNNKLLYVLLYGHYLDKAKALEAGENLSAKITGSKPWVRRFSAVHEMMSSR